MSTPETRALVLDLIDDAVTARAEPACAVLGLTPYTLRRRHALAGSDSGLLDRRTRTPIGHVWLNPPKEHASTPAPVVAQPA